MKQAFFLLAIAFGISAYGQTAFQKGNFVNKQGNTVECLIKNYDWVGTPKEIEYKITEDGQAQQMPVDNLLSFYIYNTAHYYKQYDVPVIGIQKGDVFVKSGPQLLRVLVEGEASLLKSTDGMYFLKMENDGIKPLIYKRFINGDTYEENVAFRLELYNALKCEGITQADFKKLKYSESKLIKVIYEYNECKGVESKTFVNQRTKAEFNLNVVAGLNFYNANNSIDVKDSPVSSASATIDFESGLQKNIAAGLEAEVRLPYNHKKWAVFIIPTINTQEEISKHIEGKTSYTVPTSGYSGNGYTGGTKHLNYKGNVNLKSHMYIEIPIGLRHYFILNNNSLININAAYGITLNLASKNSVTYTPDANSVNMYPVKSTSASSLIRLGAGYTLNKKYTFSLNYYVVKSFDTYSGTGSLSVLLGYKLF